jgi:hypothetical protein
MTQFTNSVVIPANNWINLGTGQLSVSAHGPEWPLVALIVSDAVPALPPPQGEVLRDRRFFNTSSNVWAIALAQATTVVVTAPDAGQGGNVVTKDAQLVPSGCFQVSVGAAASTLAALSGAAIPANARVVHMQPEGADIRWRDDGTAPTAAVGSRIYAGTDYPYNGTLSAVQLIAVSGTVTVNLRFYQ